MPLPSYCRHLPVAGLKAKLAQAASRVVNVHVLGNSIAQGYAAGGAIGTLTDRLTRGWVSVLRANLQAIYGGGGVGLIPLAWTITDGSTLWEFLDSSGDPTPNEFGPYSYCKGLYGATPGVILHGVTCDRVTVGYLETIDSSPWELVVDGGAPVGPFGSSAGTPTYRAHEITGITLGTHDLTFRPVATDGSKAYLWGMAPNVGSTGVRVHNASLSGGVISTNGANRGAADNANFYGWLDVLVPDILIVPLSSNDYATQLDPSVYSARLDALVAHAQGLGAVVLLIHDPPRDIGAATYSLAHYGDLMEAVAVARGCGFVSCQEMWGTPADMLGAGFSTEGDPVHPPNLGHEVLANTLLQYALLVA